VAKEVFMGTANKGRPIKLYRTNLVTRKGYYEATVLRAGFDGSAKKLSVSFEVDRGKNAGFRLHTDFFLKGKGLARLSYLCESVGIRGELSDPSELVGRRVRLRVVPQLVMFREGSRLVHRITRFHAVERKGSPSGGLGVREGGAP
jgi:hypothetical protein